MMTIDDVTEWVRTYLEPEQLLSRFKLLNKIALESLTKFQIIRLWAEAGEEYFVICIRVSSQNLK